MMKNKTASYHRPDGSSCCKWPRSCSWPANITGWDEISASTGRRRVLGLVSCYSHSEVRPDYRIPSCVVALEVHRTQCSGGFLRSCYDAVRFGVGNMRPEEHACVALIDNMRLLNPALTILSLGFGTRRGVTVGT